MSWSKNEIVASPFKHERPRERRCLELENLNSVNYFHQNWQRCIGGRHIGVAVESTTVTKADRGLFFVVLFVCLFVASVLLFRQRNELRRAGSCVGSPVPQTSQRFRVSAAASTEGNNSNRFRQRNANLRSGREYSCLVLGRYFCQRFPLEDTEVSFRRVPSRSPSVAQAREVLRRVRRANHFQNTSRFRLSATYKANQE